MGQKLKAENKSKKKGRGLAAQGVQQKRENEVGISQLEMKQI